MAQQLSLSRITRHGRAWPRLQLDTARVRLFREMLVDDPTALAPVIVVENPQGGQNGGYILADGHHRAQAHEELGGAYDTLAVDVRRAPEGQSPEDYAYEIALEFSAKTSVPLTQAERRAAVQRLLSEQPDLSDRAIARLAGVSPTTVGTLKHKANDVAQASNLDTPTPEPHPSPTAPTGRGGTLPAVERNRTAQAAIRAGYRLVDKVGQNVDLVGHVVADELITDQEGDLEMAVAWADWHRSVWTEARRCVASG